ncbi:Uncharacterised protein [Achromobacter xylosoxidans]|nr:Uncharacterised protein [Achromobacter xylosoxidans]
MLQVPAQRHLGRRLAMLARQFQDGLVLGDLALRQRTPRLGGDAVLIVKSAQFALREARMQLDLVDRRRDAGGVDQALQVGLGEIGHTDRAGTAVFLHLDHGAPGVDELLAARHRPMDQVQVHVGQAELFQAFVHRLVGLVETVPVIPQLGGDEQILARHPCRAQPGAHAGFIAVDRGGVHRTVAGRQRFLDAGRGLLVRHLPHAQAQLRNLAAVVQFHCGYLRHNTLPSLRRDARMAKSRQVAQPGMLPGGTPWPTVDDGPAPLRPYGKKQCENRMENPREWCFHPRGFQLDHSAGAG